MATRQRTAATRTAVDQDFVEDFMRRYLDAWSTGDVDGLLALFADDIAWHDDASPTPIRGLEEAREFVETTLRGFPDTKLELIDGPFTHPSEPKAAIHWRMTATNTGKIDPPGLVPTGNKLEIDGADFHEYENGKLVRLRVVFDMATSMRQMGALPPSGSVAERGLVFMNNLRTRLPI